MRGAVFSILVAFLLVGPALAERRAALVMAADEYRSIRPLENAVNDAEAMQTALEALGFEVTLETDRDLKRMRRALEDFREDAAGADVALVFFAGHGVEVGGENRLLPVDADAGSVETLRRTSLPLDEVRATVAAVAKVGLIVLDACRDDPFGVTSDQSSAPSDSGRGAVAVGAKRSIKPGLGRMGRAENVLFAFSAAPGQTASDGADANSPFTSALAKYLATEGLEIRSVLTLVQQEVYDRTRGRQLPYVESGLPSVFFAASSNEELPERERLLLAMAEVTPSLREEVERVARDHDMPLAPLYGALVAGELSGLNSAERGAKLKEAATAFIKRRDDLRLLAADDPEVARLRNQAEAQLALGATRAAQALYAEAVALDDRSMATLRGNLTKRVLSKAGTHYLSGTAARASLDYVLAQDELEKAVGLLDGIAPTETPPEYQQQRLLAYEALGELNVTTGDLRRARMMFEGMLALAKARAEGDPGNVDRQRDLSVSLNKLGDVLAADDDVVSALANYRSSLAIRERLAGREPVDVKSQRDLAVSMNKVGAMLLRREDIAGALASFQAGLAIAERLAARDPGDVEAQRDLSISLEKVGDVLGKAGDVSGARAAYEGSLAIVERLAAADPRWQRDLLTARTKVGDVLAAQGDLPNARRAFRNSLKIAEMLAAADPENAELQRDLIVSNFKLGVIGERPGFHYQRALDIALSMDGKGTLAPADAGIPDLLRRKLAALPSDASR